MTTETNEIDTSSSSSSLSGSNIKPSSNERKKSGIVYISRIPPTMAPHEVRSHLAPFGQIMRIYLAPDPRCAAQIKPRGNTSSSADLHKAQRRIRYVEGWVEFSKRSAAKTAVAALNGSVIGGNRRSRLHDEMWSLKCMPSNFDWSHLNEQKAYDASIRQQRLRTEISQGRKSAAMYASQSERAEAAAYAEHVKASSMAHSTAAPVPINRSQQAVERQMAVLAKKFRQRKPIAKS